MILGSYKAFKAAKKFFFAYTWPLKKAAFRAGRKLTHVAGRPDGKNSGGVCAVAPYYGDARMLTWFLTYYRRLGIASFAFLDLSASRDLAAHESLDKNCAVWLPSGKFVPADLVHALNFLRHRYARDKWCLSVEPCDFLVFPKSETRHIRDLIDFVENEQRDHVSAVIVDTYGDGSVTSPGTGQTESPFARLPFFDRFGYQTLGSQALGEVTVVGGVRRRSLYSGKPLAAPPLNRVPLLKLKWDCYYVVSTRRAVPERLNAPHAPWHSTTTACLLRYALLSNEMALHVAKLMEAGQIETDDSEPLFQGSEAMAAMSLKTQGTGRYRNSRDLLDCGLLNNGQWF